MAAGHVSADAANEHAAVLKDEQAHARINGVRVS
jgi:hypothetical protein